jgi:CHAD domain-containing protein
MTAPLAGPALCARPAAEAVRLIALARLDEAAAALTRLDAPEDTEALHDFRVALRRLRSVFRAYRPLLGDAARQRVRRRLRRLAAATGAGRDAEVLLDWLRSQDPSVAARERVGWRWLIARLEARRTRAVDELASVRGAFVKLERRLRRRLGTYQLTIDVEGGGGPTGPTFGEVAAAATRTAAEALERRLGDVTAEDPGAVHAARISAKRLRYVLEPAMGDSVVVDRLRDLQDQLGELCDTRVAEQELAEAVEAAGAERARLLFERSLTAADGPAPRRRDERSGLVALARLARGRWDRGFARLEAEWLRAGAAPLLRAVAQAAARMEAASSSRLTDAGEPAAGADPWMGARSGGPHRRRRRRAPRSSSEG